MLAASWTTRADCRTPARTCRPLRRGCGRSSTAATGSSATPGERSAASPTRVGATASTRVTDGNGGGTLRPDGAAPTPPLADADTQAVTVAALRVLAADSPVEDEWRARHDVMRALVTATYLPDVVLVDCRRPGARAPARSWAGCCGPTRSNPTPRAAAAARLAQPDICTDYGLRTLSSRFAGLPPDGYHRGTIWPFDSWLGWGGLRAAGRPTTPSGSAPACSRRSTNSAASPSSTASLPGESLARAGSQPRPGLDDRGPVGTRRRMGRRARPSVSRRQSWGCRAARSIEPPRDRPHDGLCPTRAARQGRLQQDGRARRRTCRCAG